MRTLKCCLAVALSAVSAFAEERRPVVAIADYLETNGVVSAKRGMTEALREAGFAPVILSEMDAEAVRDVLSRCDAVMIGGGIKGQDYDRRCAFEDLVITVADEGNLPIVGICHGAQVINRHFGGTLGPVPQNARRIHKDPDGFARTGMRTEHDATVPPGDSLMARVFGAGSLRINSSHTRCCTKMADGFNVTARAADGVVEAFEHRSRPIFGFQFHPEYYWQKDKRCLDLLRQALSPWKAGWRLDKYSRIEGNLLIVDVPAGASGSAARRTVDLTRFPKGVEMHIRCRGENVSKPAEGWLGSKFMLHFTDGEGVDQWPGASQKSGTFDWCDLRFAKGLGKGVKDGTGELTLGLQEATGKIVFDLSTLRIIDRGALWAVPEEDRGFRCSYTPSVADAPRKRGVMLSAGPCKEDDFRTLREWGATLVRYQMCRNWSKDNDNRDLGEYDRWLDGKLDHLDREVLPWAEKYGLDVVVDLHVAPGGRANSDMNMFYEKDYGDHFVRCWQKIARRFKGRTRIYGYDLINEPNQQFAGVPDGDWWSLQRRAAEAVREIDPDVTLVIESNGWDSPKTFPSLRPLRMTNVIYQAHMYQPMSFTHQGVNGAARWTPTKYPDPEKGWDIEFLRRQLADVRKFQQEHGAKIYIGEFSAIAWAEGADAYLRDCISIFEEYGWDWSYHAFREWAGWDVEKSCTLDAQTRQPRFSAAADTPRRRALLRGLRGE